MIELLMFCGIGLLGGVLLMLAFKFRSFTDARCG